MRQANSQRAFWGVWNHGPMNRSGLSLTELMIAVALIGIGILGAIASYSLIQRAIQGSKARSLAANLAQEKMQIIMQKSYYEILVTTAPAFNTSINPTNPIPYDPNYFIPETILEGSIVFTRLTYVQIVQEVNGVIQPISDPTTPDTGMRQITISTLWQSGGSGSSYDVLTIQNIINNPNTVMSDVILKGTVTDAVTTKPIPAALVDVAENVGWRASTDPLLGNYQMHLSPGTFDFVASAQGYFQKVNTLTVAPYATPTLNFTLTPMSSGTIQGTAWLNNHLVISQVVATTGTANDIEYVELYNPTPFAIEIGSNNIVNSPYIAPIVWDQGGNPSPHHLYYNNSWVPANGYYLIANTGSPQGNATSCNSFMISGTVINPDACWEIAHGHTFVQGDAGGFSLGDVTSYTGTLGFNSTTWPSGRIDSVAWSDTASGNAAPVGAVEGTGITTPVW